jgi:subtilase family serine protease
MSSFKRSRRSPQTTGVGAALVVAALAVAAIGGPAFAAAGTTTASTGMTPNAAATVQPIPEIAGHLLAATFATPLTTTQCEQNPNIMGACYSPLQFHVAYDLNPLYAAGINGAGRTIVIVDAFGSPTVQADLNTFDKQWHLPDTVVDVVKFGKIPVFDPENSTMADWAGETSLDVQYAHAIAPGAKIVLAETPVDELEGDSGLPQMMNAERYLIDHGVGDVISQSFGATENTFPGFAYGDHSSLLRLRYAFQDAAVHRVTVLAGSGDLGAAGYELDAGTLYPYPVNTWPSSDPLVTSVGGTRLDLDDAGGRLSPDVVWSAVYGASGGGLSQVFTRPGYQNTVKSVVGTRRGTPDVSMSGAVDGGAWVYLGYPGGGGWNIVGGTSESAPLMAGVVALADQACGHRLGLINPTLYALGAGPSPARAGIVDITSGDNGLLGVPGYDAEPGYDLASGLGTLDVKKFVAAIAATAH